jgi:single-strand DNA-binding protein
MNTLKNRVNLVGRIGSKPELQELTGGYQLTRFSLATNEGYKDKAGVWHDKTQWHNISAWGKTAESIVSKLDKGVEVALEGKLINKQYTTKTGEKRSTTEIEIDEYLVVNRIATEKTN